MLRYFIILLFTLSSISQAQDRNLSRSIALGKSPHFSAVGYLDVISNTDGGRSEGTATHIGEGILVTAAHALSKLFPEEVPNSGPVILEITKYKVIWSNRSAYYDIEPAKEYEAVRAVVDAKFIRKFRESGTTLEELDHDIAFVELKEIPETGSIPLAINTEALPDYAVLVGYGSTMLGIKHAFSQTLGLRAPLNQSRQIISDVTRYDIVNYVLSRAERKQSCDIIFSRNCEQVDIFSIKSSPGDSGGPLIATINGEPKIVGILSYGSQEHPTSHNFVYDDPNTSMNETSVLAKSGPYVLGDPLANIDPIVTTNHNGYVSILTGSPGDFHIHPDVDKLYFSLIDASDSF